jgi:hypothetical protein
MSFSREQRLIMSAAFRRAWRTLLVEERITAQNIEVIPTMLMDAIVTRRTPANAMSSASQPRPSTEWRTKSVMILRAVCPPAPTGCISLFASRRDNGAGTPN